MLFAHLLSITAVDNKKSPAESAFIEKFSLMHPHVSENGRGDFYVYDGHYFIKTRTSTDYSQLGYLKENTTGLLQMREPIKNKNFKFEVEFSLEAAGGGAGSGFWISDNLSIGEFYGRNRDFKGFGVVLDTKDRSYVKFVDSSQPTLSKSTYVKFNGKINELVFENLGKRLEVKLFVENSEYLIYSGVSSFDPSYVFGVSHSTGNTDVPLRINSIAGYTLSKPKQIYVKGETRKSRKLVIFVGFCCIVGLFLYLYSKQSKSMMLKN